MNTLTLFKSRPVQIIAAVAALAVVVLLASHVTSHAAQGPAPQDIFTGIVTLDQNGEATIAVPSAVTEQDTNFNYQAKSMGAPMPNLHLKSEIEDGHFSIAGGTPGGQVMWQLFAVREAP